MTSHKQFSAHFWVPRTFAKLETGWKNLFLPNIASWGPTGSKNTKISIFGIFFVKWPKMAQNFQNFRIFLIFYQPWTIHFWNKNFDFFPRKFAKFLLIWFFQKIAHNLQNFRFFFDFCTNHDRSIFGIKISRYFSQKLTKFGGLKRFFHNVTKNVLVPKLQPIEAVRDDGFLILTSRI